MNVDDVVAERIAAAQRKTEADKQARAELAAARSAGLAARHAAKLDHLAQDERAVLHCPACRRQRPARRIGSGAVLGRLVVLVECCETTCGLAWVVRPDGA
ncbi:hypothetical protein [Streptomyces iconiensis]|uniref:Uncharacterized protein n=1 Tax=Streptomyces iconiensis TaxID=1384038 RepID=A0ABT6ZRR8_9ACTN|nr:hypothetical protein [Streptomyces iconiensis]MDJ1131767.1 hypothetical protein [Streptomyces iconiensis]